jgi:hypothetical protein
MPTQRMIDAFALWGSQMGQSRDQGASHHIEVNASFDAEIAGPGMRDLKIYPNKPCVPFPSNTLYLLKAASVNPAWEGVPLSRRLSFDVPGTLLLGRMRALVSCCEPKGLKLSRL